MSRKYRILIMGASYGSLLGTKLALGGHDVTLVCLPAEVAAFNASGAIIRIPVKGIEGLVEINSKNAPGKLTAAGPADVNPKDFDLVALAMQEPQYRTAGARELLDAVARAKVPAMSIMNMPPMPYLARLPGVDMKACRDCFADATVWDSFDPKFMTLCSPDPQAFRPPEEPVNVLQVRLPTNFKAARFESDAHTQMLRELEASVDAVRFNHNGQQIELPVKLKVHDSVFVPLAKWAMLLAGNYRCIGDTEMRPIKDAVHADLEQSRQIYNWVVQLCVKIGAKESDMVPFEKYAAAAQGLGSPSSAARALFGGAQFIERVDRLVQAVASQHGMRHPEVDAIVARVDSRLVLNRQKAA